MKTPTKRHRVHKRHPLAAARGVVELAGSSFERITRHVHAVHRSIADVPFGTLAEIPLARRGSRPVRIAHDGITDGIHATVRAAGALAFGAAAELLKIAQRRLEQRLPALPAPATPAAESNAAAPAKPLRDNLLSAVNGAFGDLMAARRNPLAVQFGFYQQGALLALDGETLSASLTRVTPRIVIFLHGLCCNEHSWRLYADDSDAATAPYGERLAADLDYTPFYLRYNTGLHISQNGRAAARLLSRLSAAFPIGIEEIVLVGHSMGGLVARSACAYGQREDAAWTRRVSHVICLGSPHLGAPLEKAVHAGTAVMDAFKLSRPWAELLNSRSAGIKDLRHGYVSHDDWRGFDADAPFENRRSEIARLPHARYHFIGSSLGVSSGDWLGRLAGDGLVRLPSSTAHRLADADTAVLYRTHHMRLLNHPLVYRELAECLREPFAPKRAATVYSKTSRKSLEKALGKPSGKPRGKPRRT